MRRYSRDNESLTYEQALNYALRLLSQRNYTVAKLTEKLENRGTSEADIQRVVAKLTDLHFIDDTRYTELFIREQTTFRHASAWTTEQKLRQKGVAPAIIKSQLTNAEDTELENAVHHIKRLLRRYEQPLTFESKQKILASLARRGFSISIGKKAIILAENNEDSEDLHS